MNDVDNGPQLPIAPPLVPLSALLLAIILEWIPLSFLAEPLSFNLQVIAGLVLLAIGLWLDVSAFRLFLREGTNPMPTQPALKVVTTGPYRFTRNPMYLGMVALLLGLSLIFSLEWGVIFTPIVWIIMDRVIVLREEAYLPQVRAELSGASDADAAVVLSGIASTGPRCDHQVTS